MKFWVYFECNFWVFFDIFLEFFKIFENFGYQIFITNFECFTILNLNR